MAEEITSREEVEVLCLEKNTVYIVERPDEGQPGCSVILQERTLQETPVDRQLKLLRAGGFRPDFQHERAAEWFCV